MSAQTTRRSLYLFGGGSDGQYGPDEVMDVSKINSSLVKLDGDVYPSVASLTALVALLPQVPEGALVSVGTYTISGALQHYYSVWQKLSGKWRIAPGTAIVVYGEAAGSPGVTDLANIGGALSTFVTSNAASIDLQVGTRIISGQNMEVRQTAAGTWKGWETPFFNNTPGVQGPTSSFNSGGRFRYTGGKVKFEFRFTLTAGNTSAIIRVQLPINIDTSNVNSAGQLQEGVLGLGIARRNDGVPFQCQFLMVNDNYIEARFIKDGTTGRTGDSNNDGSGATPFTWQTNCSLSGLIEYDPA